MKADKLVGMIGFISMAFVIIGSLVKLWTANIDGITKLIGTGAIGFVVCYVIMKGTMENAEKKEFEKNRKSFKQRLEDIQNQNHEKDRSE